MPKQNTMIKPRKKKVKSIENGETIIAMTMATTLITTVKIKIIIIIIVIMRIKIGNHIRIQKL